MGFLTSILKFSLIIVNTIFLIIGLLVCIFSAILLWGNDILGEIKDIDFIDFSSLYAVSIILLIIGVFIIALSVIGLIGACSSNRFFLVVYEIIIGILFLTHLIALIYGAVAFGEIENLYKNELNVTMAKLNDPLFLKDNPKEAATYCAAFKVLSEVFDCCGVYGDSDFKQNVTFRQVCCADKTVFNQIGCADKSWNTLKNGATNYLIIPNSVILVFEFCLIVGVPIFIKNISRRKKGSDYIPPTYYRNK
jgi:hypothetical protein